ncbi:hypothetical protein [Agrococcus sp. SGAir0287]|uniref:hypothetical protein n=1 Tax=Agrococcus sp. SGAir0287 TaxID=2070347 RepID=UPI0010CCE339|nr:hypothetical protein [Agrococcus sp. SGAir0287]QCR18859.1 hypothetical protein C1N71_04845 [Agrococcus sp. SGAir0287]
MRWWARLPWWGRALAIWAASRVVSTSLLAAFAAAQPANVYTAASPSLVELSTIWDARWYEHVATRGYPDVLPREPSGAIDDNAWAFMPVYPMLVRALVRLGLDWQVAALVIAWAASAVFAVLAYRLLRETIPQHAAFALAIVLLGPVAPLLQVGYAESLHLALLAGALLALRHRRWVLLAALVPLMALTRPSGLAFALALGIVAAWSWWRERDAWPRRDLRILVALAAWALAWGLAWPAYAAVRTGEPGAYVATELGWRAPYVGPMELVPGTGWVAGAQWWLGGMGLGLLAIVVGGLVWVLARRATREAMGVEAWAWTVAYLLYLLAVWFPQSSTFRILLPAYGLAAVVAVLPGRWWRPLALVACIAGQVWWLGACWWVVGVDWTIP